MIGEILVLFIYITKLASNENVVVKALRY
jgi:hypothetical protein